MRARDGGGDARVAGSRRRRQREVVGWELEESHGGGTMRGVGGGVMKGRD